MHPKLKALHNTFWLAEPSRFTRAIHRVLSFATCPTRRELAESRRAAEEAVVGGPRFAASGRTDTAEMQLASGKALRAVKGNVGVIPIHGPIQQHYSSELEKADGTATDMISRALDVALTDPQVGAIVLHIDSPGGGSYGVEELSDKIFSARGRKPIYAIADSLMASAAYWIGTAADMVFATPGGDVGSVGVFAIHVDESKALEQEGVSVSLVKAGKHKAEFAPFGPLSEESRANLQAQVDYTYDKFTGALKRNRNVTKQHVLERFGEGRVLNPDQALEAGMIDRILSFEALIGKLTGAGSESSQKATSVAVLRMRQEHRKRTT